MSRKHCWSVALVALFACPALAGHKIEVVPADQVAAATPDARDLAPSDKRISFKLTDVTIEQAVAEAQKQTGLTLRYDVQREPRGPQVVYDVAVDAATRDEAMDQFGKALRLSVSQMNDGLVLRHGSPVGFTRPAGIGARTSPSGPPRATVDGVRISRSFAKASLGQQNSLILLRVWPGQLGMRGQPTATLTEAIDEQDRNLIPAKPDPDSNNWGFAGGSSDGGRGSVQFAVPFDCPSPRPKSIKRLRATVQFRIPASFDRLSIDGFDDETIDCTMGKIPFKFGPLKKVNFAWMLSVRYPAKLPREIEDVGGAYQVLQTLDAARVTSVDGEELRFVRTSTSQTDEWIDITCVIQPDNRTRPIRATTRPTTRPSPQSDRPMPKTLVWDVPREYRTIEIPVEANDLVIP